MRGLFSMGIGRVGLCQEIVLLMAQGFASHEPASSLPSSESSSDASWVWWANSLATSWSIDVLDWTAPELLFAPKPVRNLVAAPECDPLLFAPFRPDTTRRRSRNGARGFRTGDISNAAPSAAGVQLSMAIPLGTYTTPRRWTGRAAVWAPADRAGTIASSNGNASVAPIPRRNVLRGSAILVRNMVTELLSRLETRGSGLGT